MAAIIADLIVIAVTMLKTVRHVRESRSLGMQPSLSQTMLRDGVSCRLSSIAQKLIAEHVRKSVFHVTVIQLQHDIMSTNLRLSVGFV